MNKRFLLTLACVGILIFVILTPKGNCAVKNDDILYFHSMIYSVGRLMDINFPNGTYDQFISGWSEQFVSPPLPQDFDFSGGTVEIFHAKPSPERGTYKLQVSFSYVDAQGHLIGITMPFYKQISYGSTFDSISCSFAPFKLFSGESIVVYLMMYSSDYMYQVNMYWGNATYSSNFSYSGNVFIPELSWQAMSVFMLTSFVAVAIFKVKSRKLKCARLEGVGR